MAPVSSQEGRCPQNRAHSTARPATEQERAFLAIGEGAEQWLLEAAAAGTTKMRVKMDEAIQLAALLDRQTVDRALGAAATAGRFGDRDLGLIIDHLQHHPTIDGLAVPGDDASLQNGLDGWRVMGR